MESNETIPDLKLKIELVPQTARIYSIRREVSPETWNFIRQMCYQKYSNRCGICGIEGKPLECHEMWDYHEDTCMQKFGGLIALCPDCHDVKHIGMAHIKAGNGLLDFDELIRHFCKVNQCTEKEYKQHFKDATEEYERRSKIKWNFDNDGFVENLKKSQTYHSGKGK